jgi:aryl-alcohol dehydrogenase-like predicted oxidoreductase
MSKLVFGTGGRFGRLSRSIAFDLVDYAIECGITRFDTGISYCRGRSQALLFDCLNNHKDKDILISTKISPEDASLNYEEMFEKAKIASCRYIDVLFLWGPSLNDLNSTQIVKNLARIKKDGLVNKIGVNTHDLDIMSELFNTAIITNLDSVMIDYNIIQQDRSSLISQFSCSGIDVWAGTSLCQGFLTQSLFQIALRSRSVSYVARAFLNKPTIDLKKRAKPARDYLRNHYQDIYKKIPLSYVLSNNNVRYVPVGMLSSSSINSNIEISNNLLPQELLHKVAREIASLL